MINVLFSAAPARWDQYNAALRTAFKNASLDVNLSREFEDPKDVDYLVIAPNGPITDFSPFTNAKAALNLWAGVESLMPNPTLTMPLARMVDSGLSEGMREYVCGHALRYHLEMDNFICAKGTEWRYQVPPLARHRTVGILGLGELGSACAQALTGLGFNTLGWSRTPKEIANVKCYSGTEGLAELLSQTEILVLLLPLTAQTENVINAETLAMLPKGARIINPGRGALIDDDALLAALNTGHIAHATLDVFRVEPLPSDHPYWHCDNVTITPHNASETRADTSSEIIADNIRRSEAGEPLRFLVDRSAGY
ncbi:2-hydroxyacid dehydrogenase [Falsihalocynthiibacter sp. SS001]|uniref:2-hydroxyacid dehydrogenase n=1 Tax=Falsihalocynthiibacter sp. SS001 TaxID=3349698 RepID=UPI0036D37232